MQTQRGFPNDSIFNQLRRLAKQSPGVLFHDEYGVDARYNDLIRDVIHLREILREHLPSASFDELGCLREDAKSVAFLAYSGYGFIISFFAIVALGGICVPLCKSLSIVTF
jgi:malonyl-CoA/methylmalonyl-CoA synthetase